MKRTPTSERSRQINHQTHIQSLKVKSIVLLSTDLSSVRKVVGKNISALQKCFITVPQYLLKMQ